MECAFGLAELASHNAFLRDYEQTGYSLDFVGGYLVVYGLPYLNKDGALQYGDWASTLDLNGFVIDPPLNNHQAWWRGSRPCDQSGRELKLGGGVHAVTVTNDFVSDSSFSFKLLDENGAMRAYVSFEEKLRTYLDAITAPAMAVYPEATPLAAIATKATAQGSPLRIPDTMSSRYHLNDLSGLLRGKMVAIIGLGGTGSYILDFLARTHLQRIALFDEDKVHVHTLFRIPGFIPNAVSHPKVEVLARQYAHWHDGIEATPEKITSENIERLKGFDFVFVSIDNGPSRRFVVDWLTSHGIAFVDCGMGLNRSKNGLSGFVRITGVDRGAFDENVGTSRLPIEPAKEDDYRKESQIAELNALNAVMAVIRFKQHFGLFDREISDTASIFDTSTFQFN